MKNNKKVFIPWLALIVSAVIVALPVTAMVVFAPVSIPMTVVSGVLTAGTVANCVRLVREVVEENKMLNKKEDNIEQKDETLNKASVKDDVEINVAVKENKATTENTKTDKIKEVLNRKKENKKQNEDLHIEEDENTL